MRHAWLAFAPLLLLAPGAHACSLVWMPFDDPQFRDGLWYGDTSSVRHAEGVLEGVVAEGYFLSFARLEDDGLLIAGQDGLGADCSGDGWLELRRGDQVVWRREEQARVFAHSAGPFVLIDGRFWRLDGDELVRHVARWGSAQPIGWTDSGQAVQWSGHEVRIGERILGIAPETQWAAAGNDGQTVAVAARQEERVVLHVVDGTQVGNVSWAIAAGGWSAEVVRADAWVVLAGQRAYHVTDAGAVTDLGVDEAHALAVRNGNAVVFEEDGYTVFQGTRGFEAWERKDGVWSPVPPTARPAPVPSDVDAPGPWAHETAFEEGMHGPDDEPDVWTIPAPSLALLAVLLAVAATRRGA